METGATALASAAEDLISATCPFRPNRPADLPAGAEIGFVTEDVPAAFALPLAAGATAVAAPTTKPWGQVVSYVRDLNGGLVEICSRPRLGWPDRDHNETVPFHPRCR